MEYQGTRVMSYMNATYFKTKVEDNNYFNMRETVVIKMS